MGTASEQPKRTLLFTCGTLKRGFFNHPLLQELWRRSGGKGYPEYSHAVADGYVRRKDRPQGHSCCCGWIGLDSPIVVQHNNTLVCRDLVCGIRIQYYSYTSWM